MSARDAILNKLKANQQPSGAAQAVTFHTADALCAQIDAHFDARRAEVSHAELLQQMQQALQVLQAKVFCASVQDWPQQLAQQCQQAGVKSLLLANEGDECRALSAALQTADRSIVTRHYPATIDGWQDVLFHQTDAGFTVVDAGIAATGTLIVRSSPQQPRTASLVPPLHIALVYASTLYADMHQAMRAMQWADAMPSNLVMISGPSKTSDIQQTLAFGAHGPRWLHVWLIDDLNDVQQGGAA